MLQNPSDFNRIAVEATYLTTGERYAVTYLQFFFNYKSRYNRKLFRV